MLQSVGSNEDGIPLSTDTASSLNIDDGLIYFSYIYETSQQTAAADAEIGARLRDFIMRPATLGLQLSKTPSLLEFVELNLSLKVAPSDHHNSSYNPLTEKAEKFKAVHFPISLLQIGGFRIVATHEADLVAKCYYAKRKLVWEILDRVLKNKIEIQWQEILAMRASFEENRPGILEIELSQPPTFFHESDPKPRKHTIWKASSDFTGGQASTYRRHYLEFPPGVLDKHYEKLIQCDSRLFQLSQKPFPSVPSPYFTDFSYEASRQLQQPAPVVSTHPCGSQTYEASQHLQQPLPCIPAPVVSTQPVQQFGNAIPSSLVISDLTSPTSVIADDIYSTNDGVINNQTLNPMLPFWSQGVDYENFCAMDSTQSAGDVELQTTNYVQLQAPGLNCTNFSNMEILTDSDSAALVNSLSALSTAFNGLPTEVDPTYSTKTSTQFGWCFRGENPLDALNFRGENSLEALTLSTQEPYPASNANVRHMYGELSDEGRLNNTQSQPLHHVPPLQVFNENLETPVTETLYSQVIPEWSGEHNNYHDCQFC